MRGLDDTDREIIQLLLENARRPYSDIADEVDLSAPAVSDRIDRLQEIGLVRRFTVDLDRSLLQEGVPVLVQITGGPDAGEEIREELTEQEAVEHVFQTVDDRIVCTATVPDGEVSDALGGVLSREEVRSYDVRLLADTDWSPNVGRTELAPTCVECGNTVTAEGETERLDDTVYHFCCRNCRDAFIDQYERIQEGA